MQKEEFINRIINSFPTSFKERNRDEVFDEYDRGLRDGIDFDKLFSYFAADYDKPYAPRPAFFQQYYDKCSQASDEGEFWKNMSPARRSALVRIANYCNSEEYNQLLYKGKDAKAPPDLRELYRRYNFQKWEIDLARLSENLGQE